MAGPIAGTLDAKVVGPAGSPDKCRYLTAESDRRGHPLLRMWDDVRTSIVGAELTLERRPR